MLEDGSAAPSRSPAKHRLARHRLLWQRSWSTGKNSSVSDAACGGGGDGNTLPRFSLMKPEQHCEAQESLIHTITYRWDCFWVAGWFRSCLLEIYEDGSQPVQGKLNLLVVENEIRPPNVPRRNSDPFNAGVIVWVPLQVHVFPLLRTDTQKWNKVMWCP